MNTIAKASLKKNIRLSLDPGRSLVSVVPNGWAGPRGNFAPTHARDRFLGHPVCQETLFTSPPGLINLDTGAPGPSLLRRAQETLKGAVEQWSNFEPSFLSMQYGPTQGSGRFREQLADFLTRQYGAVYVSPDSLFQTNGATQGLSQCLTTFFGCAEKKEAFVEDPTYFLAPKMLREHGFKVNAVPVTRSGMCMDRLEASLRDASNAGRLDGSAEFSGIIYCVPSYHNPTGCSMPESSRKHLVELAHKYRMLVVADDVYELLPHGRVLGPDRLVSYDLRSGADRGHVISNSTFSKIVAPGVRTGWIEAGSNIIHSLQNSAGASSSGANNQTMGAILAEMMCSQDLDQLLQETRQEYFLRMQAVQTVFAQHAPAGCTLSAPEGGMCLWVTMPPHFDSHEVLIQAREAGISFKPGDLFSSSIPASSRNCFRVVVPHYDSATLVGAVRTLCQILSSYAMAKS